MNNQSRGIEVRDDSRHVNVVDVQLTGNRHGGIRVRESAIISILRSDVSGNGDDGVLMTESDAVSVAKNTIRDNVE